MGRAEYYCWLVMFAIALRVVGAAPRDAGLEGGLNENTSGVLDLIPSFFIYVAAVLAVLPFLIVTIICCKSRRRRTELDSDNYKDLELNETKWSDLPEKIDDSADESKCLSDSEDKKVSDEKTATSFPSLLFATLPPPPPPPLPSNGHLEKERSFRRSFKLPVLPPEAQRHAIPGLGGAIPVPRLVETYKQNSSSSEIKLSPYMHRRSPISTAISPQSDVNFDKGMNSSLTYKHSIEPVRLVDSKAERFWKKVKIERFESKTLPGHTMRKESGLPFSPTHESQSHKKLELSVSGASRQAFLKECAESVDLSKPCPRPLVLQHAKSLDEMLDFSENREVTIDLDPTKKSKYSRVTITASLEILNENTAEQQEVSDQSSVCCEEIPDESSINLGKSSLDAVSVLSYTLTNDMIGSNDHSSKSSLDLSSDSAGSYSLLVLDDRKIKDCSVQLEEAGIETAGIEPAGIEPTGIEHVGIEDAGIEVAGIEADGIEPAGIEAAGIEAAGIEPAGIEDAGIEAAGIEEEGEEKNGSVEEINGVSVLEEEEEAKKVAEEVAEDGEEEGDKIISADVSKFPHCDESSGDIVDEFEGEKVMKNNNIEDDKEMEEVIMSGAGEDRYQEEEEEGVAVETETSAMLWDEIELTEVRIQGEDDVANRESQSSRLQVRVEEGKGEIEFETTTTNSNDSDTTSSEISSTECTTDEEDVEHNFTDSDAESAHYDQDKPSLGEIGSELEYIVNSERVDKGRFGRIEHEEEIEVGDELEIFNEGVDTLSSQTVDKLDDLEVGEYNDTEVTVEQKDNETGFVDMDEATTPNSEIKEGNNVTSDIESSITLHAAINKETENNVLDEEGLTCDTIEPKASGSEQKEECLRTEAVEESSDMSMEITDHTEVENNSYSGSSTDETDIEMDSEVTRSLESIRVSQDARNIQQVVEPIKDTEVHTVIVKFEPEGTLENWPKAIVEDDPVPIRIGSRESMSSDQDTGRGNVVEDDKKKSLPADEGVSSGSIENLKLFYTAFQEKASSAPTPPLPPSPPKETAGATSDLDLSQSLSFSTLRPSSTLSLPIPSPLSTSPILNRSLPAPPLPASLPSSPTEKIPRSSFTAPNSAARLFKKSSPQPYFSSDSGTDEEEDNILRRSRLRRPIKHRRRSTQPSVSKAGACMPSAFLSPDSSPLHHSFRSDSERKNSKEEDQGRKRESDDMRPTCLGCGDYLPFILKGEPTKTGGRNDNVPIYYVLERPSMCQSCLQGNNPDSSPERRRSSKASMVSLPPSLPPRDSPPLPPLPTPPALPALPYQNRNGISSAEVEDPVYETVVSTRRKEQEKGKENGSRNLPPISLEFTRKSREFHTSSDYESISSFETSLNGPEKDDRRRSFRNRQGNRFGILDSFEASSHDYETISLDYTRNPDNAKSDCVNKPHSYARISVKDRIEEADSPMEPRGSISASASDKRNKLMKIDSHGYASVLPPGAEDHFWEELDSNQQPASSDLDQDQTSSMSSRKHRVSNTEEAWKHQLERGYAPLTLKTQHNPSPAPLLNRTSSDGILANSLSLVAPGSTPRDYEVPIPRHPPPPPLSLAKRKSSSPLTRQNPVFSPTCEHQAFLCNITEKDDDCCPVSVEGDSDELKIMDNDHTNFLKPGNGHRNRKHSAADIAGFGLGLGLAPSHIPLPYNSQ